MDLMIFPSETGSGDNHVALFPRQIEFHKARRPFNGLICKSGGGFQIETLNPSSSISNKQNGNSAAVDNNDASRFTENGLDQELSLGITFRRIGAGLENLGNTCFLNSVLQCLTYTEPLAAYLQSGKHKSSCRIPGFCALCAIQTHVSRALQLTGRSLAPKDLVSNLRCISRNFRSARQEDAHEYMVNLLESMHKCCLPSGVPSESQSAYEKSLVHKIFGGRLRSQVICTQCSYSSDKVDPFLDLSLEILKAESLNKALLNFTAAEMLDGGEKQYQCERCKQKVKARKQLKVDKAPHVLTVHLKRFRSQGGQKIDKKVAFGPTLDMKPFVTASDGGDLKYTLYGVLVHYGWSTHSGHYACFIRTSSGMWYSLDDSRVGQVSEKAVLDQKAYMLFYVRDRKNIVPRIPVEIPQKQNLKDVIVKKDVINNSSSKEIAVKEEPRSQNNNKPVVVVPATPKTEPKVEPAPSGISSVNMNHPNHENSTITSDSKINDCLVNEVSKPSGSQNSVGDNLDISESVALSGSIGVANESLNNRAQDSMPKRKLKKKFLKSQSSHMHVGLNLFNSSLALRKKKKHIRVKTLNSVEISRNWLGESSVPADLGPSTSEITTKTSSDLSRKRKKHSEKSVMKSDGDSEKDILNGNLNERQNQNGVIIAVKQSQQCSSTITEANQQKDSEPSKLVNGAVRKHTAGGLQETVVPRWDDTLPLTRQVIRPTSIGYVLDEWDEVLDQGKQKKVKLPKLIFDGPNPFQEIATQRIKSKKSKLKRKSSSTQPFRI
ncbi:hypothetical protein ACFE04_001581 [Oxalis oulophora]